MATKIGNDKLRINQLSEKTFQWYLGYLNAIDERDIESYKDYLSDDGSVNLRANHLAVMIVNK